MDGIPAPISRLTNMDDASVAKDIVSQALHCDLEADITESTASPYWTEDMTWCINLILILKLQCCQALPCSSFDTGRVELLIFCP